MSNNNADNGTSSSVVKRGRGRPKGSKNKPKSSVAPATAATGASNSVDAVKQGV